MKNFFGKIKAYVVAHKITSAVILIVVLLIGYWGYNKLTSTAGETRYITSKVTKGTIVSSVAGSGQVSVLNQVAINPTVSGALIRVNVKPGNRVAGGQTLFVIDNTNAQKTVRDAEISLQNANLALQKLQLQNSDTNLNTALSKAYDDGFSTVSNTFLDLPGIMSGLNNMFYTATITRNGQWNIDWYEGQAASDDHDQARIFKQNFTDAYNAALKAYNDDFDSYKSASRSSNSATLEKLITQTYDSVKLISSAIKSANNYIDFVNASIEKINGTPPTIIATNQATLNGYTSEANTALQNLLSAETQIQNGKDSFTSSDLNTQSAQISIKQAQNSLADAQQNLSDYYIKAPFDGVIASVPVIKGDNVGSGTTLGTIITSKELATVTLNEVDVAKIAIGEKTTLTFSAIPDLTITGQVVQIDSLGTVSQGVVNYGVKISFDTNDDRVKPGMSVDAKIITKVEQNVLTVPNSAVKTQGGTSYVQMFDTALPAPATGIQGSVSPIPPTNQTVEVGISDTTSTEIVSGLKEGDEIVTKTITSTTKATTTPSILGAATGNRSSGSGVRIP
ncbi:MAG: efflux RND transporter periplasmic adaptor subunit [Candidatus Nomurabacteria bacterium]|nr:efflux RND transporter periplasmic adaptor subunit [Candidatus Nomurabacteria bacterium]